MGTCFVRNIFLLLLLFAGSTGCHVYNASYLHPMFGGSTPYRTMPLKSDSAHTAVYASARITAGGANDQGRDNQVYFQGAVYNAHQFSFFNVYYGADIALGNYHVQPYHVYEVDSLVDTSFINKGAGDKLFGSWGLSGGANFTIPIKNLGRRGGEWRILGVHGSFQNEFGDYLYFRKLLSPEMANKSVHNSRLGTLGFSTEIVSKKRKGYMSLLFQYNMLLGKDYSFSRYNYGYSRTFRYGYFSPVFHYCFKQYGLYVQANIGNKDMHSVTFGCNYRIAGIKRK